MRKKVRSYTCWVSKTIIHWYLPCSFQGKLCALKKSKKMDECSRLNSLLSFSAPVVKESRLFISDFSMTWGAGRKKLFRLNLVVKYEKLNLLRLLEFCHQLHLVPRWIKLWMNPSLWWLALEFDFHIFAVRQSDEQLAIRSETTGGLVTQPNSFRTTWLTPVEWEWNFRIGSFLWGIKRVSQQLLNPAWKQWTTFEERINLHHHGDNWGFP